MSAQCLTGPRQELLGRQRGQALAEFALVSIVLALVLGGVIEFGLLYGHKIELANGARAGARWAAGHSASWSTAASPASNTIEGQVMAAGGTASLSNDDSHISIQYLDVSGATPVLCGQYSVASAGFTAQAGYTQATCVNAGNLVKVTITNSYGLMTGLLGVIGAGGVTLQGVAAMVILT